MTLSDLLESARKGKPWDQFAPELGLCVRGLLKFRRTWHTPRRATLAVMARRLKVPVAKLTALIEQQRKHAA